MRLVAVLLAVLCLSGCATQIPKAANAADVEAFVSRQLDAEWQDTGLGDSQRPNVERVRFIANADITGVMASCTATLTPGYRQVLSNARTIARLVYYTCQAMYPVDPKEYRVLSTAQIDYLYDFYTRWTIPCIRSHGYDVGGIPSRTQFRLFNGFWNPVYHDNAGLDLSRGDYDRLATECDFSVSSRFPTS